MLVAFFRGFSTKRMIIWASRREMVEACQMICKQNTSYENFKTNMLKIYLRHSYYNEYNTSTITTLFSLIVN